MSASVNKVILVGNLGKDPESRTTQSGKAVANFSLATQGFKEEETTWHNIVVWDKLAETCTKFLTKGKQVYVEGRIQNRSYTDKEGTTKYISEVVADQVKFLGKADTTDAFGG